jgi:hypothetical protein
MSPDRSLGWWGAEPMRARAPATILLFTGVGLTAYTALQCVPMPIGWLAAIAPHNTEVRSRVLLPLGEAGPRCHVSHMVSTRASKNLLNRSRSSKSEV